MTTPLLTWLADRRAEIELAYRIEQAMKMMEDPARPLGDVALACGFTSPSHFSKCYRSHYGTTPYRERGSQPTRLSV